MTAAPKLDSSLSREYSRDASLRMGMVMASVRAEVGPPPHADHYLADDHRHHGEWQAQPHGEDRGRDASQL